MLENKLKKIYTKTVLNKLRDGINLKDIYVEVKPNYLDSNSSNFITKNWFFTKKVG